jgi:hypothetical protein
MNIGELAIRLLLIDHAKEKQKKEAEGVKYHIHAL